MKKIISSLLASVIMLSTVAYASDVSVERNINDSKFEFEGVAAPNESITLYVLASGKTSADLDDYFNAVDAQSTPNDPTNSDVKNIIKFYNEYYADEDGKFDFKVGITGNSGVYKALLAIGDDVQNIDLQYVIKDSDGLPLVTGLKNATDKVTYIQNNRDDLGFFLPLYDNVDQNKVVALIEEQADKITSQETAIDVFNQATIIVALSEGDIQGISAYQDELAILADGGRYEKRYPSQAAGVDQRLQGRTFDTMADFEQALAEAVVLETIKNPNGYQNVQDVLGEFQTELGMTDLTASSTPYQQMANVNYTDIASMKTAYAGFAASSIVIIPSGGGNGGNKKNDNAAGLPFVPAVDPTPVEKDYFNDMQNAAWAKKAVNYLAENGIVSGKAEGEFYPSDTVLREEFVTMIVNAFELKKVANVSEFNDVTEDNWFYEYVLAAYQNEIISGIGDGTFGAGSKITRQDMAVILYRIAQAKEIQLSEAIAPVAFADNDSIAPYAAEAIQALQKSGIVNGMENGSFAPNNSATRAQAAQMIYGLLMLK